MFNISQPPDMPDPMKRLTENIKKSVEDGVNFRLEMYSAEYQATLRGIPLSAIAVMSTPMFDALMLLTALWAGPEDDLTDTVKITKQYTGRPTMIMGDKLKQVEYFETVAAIKEAYPDWYGWEFMRE